MSSQGFGAVLGHPAVFIIFVIVLTCAAFDMAADLSGKTFKHLVPISLMCGVANSLIASVTMDRLHDDFIPALLLLFTSFLLLLEYMLFTRENKFFLTMVFSGFLMIMSIMYSFSVVLVGCLDFGLKLNLDLVSVKGLDSIVIILTVLYLLFLRYGRVVDFENMKKIFQLKEEGTMSLFFYCIADLFLLFSSHYTVKLAYEKAAIYSISELRAFMVAFLLKDGLVLILSLMILVYQTKNVESVQRNKFLETRLDREHTLRTKDGDTILSSFCIDLNTGVIIEGADRINWDLMDIALDEHRAPKFILNKEGLWGFGNALERQYLATECEESSEKTLAERLASLEEAGKVVAALCGYCAHPEDVNLIINVLTMEKYEKRLNDQRAHVERLRLSPRRLLECMHLDGSIIRAIRDHKEDYFWCESHTVITRSEETGHLLMFVELADVDEEASEAEKLLLSATTDGLTGLLNRATLTKRIDDYMGIDGTEAGLFIIDIDNFKSINDTYGHQMGDEVIKGIAQAIRKVFRKSDILGRLGGDEFMVFALGLHDRNHAIEKGKALNEACRQVVADKTVKTSVSIGAAMFPADGKNYQELYSGADSVLYEVKEGGRNGCKVYGTK